MKTSISAGSILLIYITTWPILYAFIEVDSISLFKDTKYFFFDLRLIFYYLFLLLFLFSATKGVSRRVLLSLLPNIVWCGAYLSSFIFNLENNSDYKQFLNGFFLFSILYAYVSIYRDSINWNTVVTMYSLSFIFITLFGFYSFLRFDGGLNLISGSLSHQLWRFCGGKSVYIPSALILYMLFFRYKDQRESNGVLNIAVVLSLISISLSGQRTAIVVLLYFGLMFFLYNRLIPKLFAVVLLGVILVSYQDNIQMLIDATFGHKFRSITADGALSRIDIWTATMDALFSNTKYLVFGVSEGGLPSAYGNAWPMLSNNPHSIFLYFWSATGMLGVAVLFAVMLFLGAQMHHEKKMYKIVFYWILWLYFWFAGFYFYADSIRSDYLNIGIIIVIFSLSRLGPNQKRKRFQSKAEVLNSTPVS